MIANRGGRVRWGELLLAAVAAVSWSFLAMAGVAAVSLLLLGARETGSLDTMTAALVVLAVGGSVTPSGDMKTFGLDSAQAHTAIDIAPLGVGLVGALLLGWLFLRSLRGAGAVIGVGELAARAGAVAVLFVGVLGGLAWAGHDTVTIDGASLGLAGSGDGHGGILDRLRNGDLGDVGGELPGRIGDLVGAKAAVGFSVDTAASLLGGACWVAGVLLIALLVSRRTPLPRGWSALHRVVRPAASALCVVLVLAVGAGAAAGAYAAIGDDHPRQVLGATLLGAPNGVWLGVPLGLFVPWHGTASGVLTRVLPSPVDQLLDSGSDEPITVGRLTGLDGRVWLLVVACVLMMLTAGVLTAARTPVEGTRPLGFVGRCALPLGIAAALAFPLMVRLTGVSAGANLTVMGVDAFGAGLDLHGSVPMAALLGAAWGAGAGAAGALLARATGAAGGQATAFARGARGAGAAGAGAGTGAAGSGGARPYPDTAYGPGPYRPSETYRPVPEEANPYRREPEDAFPHGAPTEAGLPLPPRPPRRYGQDPPPEGPPPPGTPRRR